MKWKLYLSLILNFLMIGCLVFWRENHSQTEGHLVRPTGQLKPRSSGNNAVIAQLNHSSSENFCWTQLESTNNYRAYVANLRAVGCPEATVRDIVSGDTARAFARKRRELGLSGDGTGAWSFQQQKYLVAELLIEPGQTNYLAGRISTTGPSDTVETTVSGSPSQSADSVAGQSANGASNSISSVSDSADGSTLTSRLLASKPVAAPVYPLIMQNVNLDALGLTAAQKASVQALQQQFITDVGGLNQNPTDPVYLRRWQQAQPQSDLLLKAMLGITAWENYQLMAADSATPPPDPYAALNNQP